MSRHAQLKVFEWTEGFDDCYGRIMHIKDIHTMATLSELEIRELFRKMLKLTEDARGATPTGRHELDVIRNVLKFSMARLKETDNRGIANDNPAGHSDIR